MEKKKILLGIKYFMQQLKINMLEVSCTYFQFRASIQGVYEFAESISRVNCFYLKLVLRMQRTGFL